MSNQPVYVKFNGYRKNRFRLRTEIRNEGKRLNIYKIAEYPDSEGFVKEIFKVYNKVSSKDYPFDVNYTESIDDRTLKFDYIKGETLLHELELIYKKDSLIRFIKFFDNFENILNQISLETKILDKNFENIFGKYPKDKKYQILFPGILDLNLDNLIRDEKGGLHLIDYEWTFDFGIPKRYVLYRTLFYSFLKLRFPFSNKISLRNLENHFKFDETEIAQYLTWETNFLKTVNNKEEDLNLNNTRSTIIRPIKYERDCIISAEEQLIFDNRIESIENIHKEEIRSLENTHREEIRALKNIIYLKSSEITKKEKEVNSLNKRLYEFRAFQKGLIWKYLTKYRKLKKKIKNLI